jgi:AcrR family transcriptional regulator
VLRRQPASAKSEQRVRDIVRAGREVFSERGYERATTTEIAQRLGVSEATVFTYFRGKRERVRVINDWYDEIIDAIEQGLPQSIDQNPAEFIVHTHLPVPGARHRHVRAVSPKAAARAPPTWAAAPLLAPHGAVVDLLARGRPAARSGRRAAAAAAPMVPDGHLWEAVATKKPIDIDDRPRGRAAMAALARRRLSWRCALRRGRAGLHRADAR